MTKTHTIAYADCFSGISGDMILGALLHAGLDREFLLSELKKLDIGDFELQIAEKNECGIDAIKVDVLAEATKEYRHLPAILDILNKAPFHPKIIEKSTSVFQSLATAEATVHGVAIEQVHFHEVGAIDTIIDVVGTILGLHHLGIKTLFSSPLPMSRGFVKCDHGTLPLPAPAVCEILKDVPVYGVPVDKELITPTGAALLINLAEDYGPMPPMTITATGYGAGTHSLPGDTPNLFRMILGETHDTNECQEVEILETNLDDWNPEGFPHICERLLQEGALDVNLTPIQVKKGRPGFKLQVICNPATSLSLKQIILSETTAIGLRFRKEHRLTLPRETVEVQTPWGAVMAKKVTTPQGPVIYPEYEECRRIAKLHDVPLQAVYRSVHQTEGEKGTK